MTTEPSTNSTVQWGRSFELRIPGGLKVVIWDYGTDVEWRVFAGRSKLKASGGSPSVEKAMEAALGGCAKLASWTELAAAHVVVEGRKCWLDVHGRGMTWQWSVLVERGYRSPRGMNESMAGAKAAAVQALQAALQVVEVHHAP